MSRLLETIASDAVIDQAYEWLCHRRKKYHEDADVWHLRFHWADERPRIQRALLDGTYEFSPVRMVVTDEGLLSLWTAADALVLKAVA
ncbi:MAG: hypothetical protein MJE77_36035 [Proteobacteria bacterium]|nr:hypothetical protein [Pseudomonadota bacterium]